MGYTPKIEFMDGSTAISSAITENLKMTIACEVGNN
jgi:hypothetical protein